MSARVPASQAVLVLGGAPEAACAVEELLALGHAVHWVLPDSAPTPLDASPAGLTCYPGAALARLDGHVGSFAARLAWRGQTFSVPVGALVVATGNERYLPTWPAAASRRVLSLAQAQSRWDGSRREARRFQGRVGFMLDWYGDSSKELAVESLRLAVTLRRAWHLETFVLYRDLPVDSPLLEQLTRDMRDSGVVFLRYVDPRLTADDEQVLVQHVDGSLPLDELVLPEAVRPGADTATLASALRVRLGADGYFQDLNIRQLRPGLSARKGIFLAGRCHLDAAPEEQLDDALQVAAQVNALLGSGYVAAEEVVAEVDTARCIRCLTCVRTCPHAAAEVLREEGVLAARVEPVACRGCGACVANCPVHAIALVGETLPAWMEWR